MYTHIGDVSDLNGPGGCWCSGKVSTWTPKVGKVIAKTTKNSPKGFYSSYFGGLGSSSLLYCLKGRQPQLSDPLDLKSDDGGMLQCSKATSDSRLPRGSMHPIIGYLGFG